MSSDGEKKLKITPEMLAKFRAKFTPEELAEMDEQLAPGLATDAGRSQKKSDHKK